MNKSRDSELLPFHFLSTVTLSGGTSSFSLNPSALVGTTRIPAVADTWAHFRVKKFAYRMHPRTSLTGPASAAFVGGVQDTLPGSLAQVMELLPAAFISNQATVPTEWIHVKKQELSGALPWYKSLIGTADATEEAPGVMSFVGSGTDVLYVEFRGIYEFKTSVSTGNTPQEAILRAKLREERILLHRDRERTKLLSALAVPTAK